MKRFSRIEKEKMRNVMHTVEWTGDIRIKHEDIELIDAQKEFLKEIIMNENKNNKEFGINFYVDLHCTLDGEEIDFDILSDGSKEYILDMILFENIKEGTYIEIFPEPIECEDYPSAYSARNGYED